MCITSDITISLRIIAVFNFGLLISREEFAYFTKGLVSFFEALLTCSHLTVKSAWQWELLEFAFLCIGRIVVKFRLFCLL